MEQLFLRNDIYNFHEHYRCLAYELNNQIDQNQVKKEFKELSDSLKKYLCVDGSQTNAIKFIYNFKTMSNYENKRICPLEMAGALDNSLRKLFQNPQRILSPFISEGMTVLDLGCGPGFFSIMIAKMLNNSGKVIAADLQEGMLEKVMNKIKGTELEKRIEIHKCEKTKIGITETVDFVLAFYLIHEVPDQDKLFEELKSILKPNGKIYIIEPKFHVSKRSFDDMIIKLESLGFEIIERPKVFFSRAVFLTNSNQ